MAVQCSVRPANAPQRKTKIERRRGSRKRPGPVTTGQVAPWGGFGYFKAAVQDISASGIALLLRHALQPGTQVMIQLRNELLELAFDLPAKVVHANKLAEGTWAIGCAFTRELTPGELETLV